MAIQLDKFQGQLIGKINLLRQRLSCLRGNCYSEHFNTAVKRIKGEWYSSERVIEWGFIQRELALKLKDPPWKGVKILDFGCSRSDLAIQLASLGAEVVGVDLRFYPLQHPNFKFIQKNILDWEEQGSFDFVLAVSTLEHVGLGAYGEKGSRRALTQTMKKIVSFLADGGTLLLTLPVGQPHRDHFIRSFSPERAERLFLPYGMVLKKALYYRRFYHRFWLPCQPASLRVVSNRPEARAPLGANGLGCFVWEKKK